MSPPRVWGIWQGIPEVACPSTVLYSMLSDGYCSKGATLVDALQPLFTTRPDVIQAVLFPDNNCCMHLGEPREGQDLMPRAVPLERCMILR